MSDRCEAGCRYAINCRNVARWRVKTGYGFQLKVCTLHKKRYETKRNKAVKL